MGEDDLADLRQSAEELSTAVTDSVALVVLLLVIGVVTLGVVVMRTRPIGR